MENVNRLKEKVDITSKYIEEEEKDALTEEITNMKIKKKMEYDYQKQKIN